MNTLLLVISAVSSDTVAARVLASPVGGTHPRGLAWRFH
jgi:hypothetical protein